MELVLFLKTRLFLKIRDFSECNLQVNTFENESHCIIVAKINSSKANYSRYPFLKCKII